MTESGARQRRLAMNELADRVGIGLPEAETLLDVARLLGSQVSLRRSLTDPNARAATKQDLARQVFQGRVGDPITDMLVEISTWEWDSGRALVDELDRSGVRGILQAAEANGELDTIREELFRFGRTVVGDSELGRALDNPARPLPERERLVDDLLSQRAHPLTVTLAKNSLDDPQVGIVNRLQWALDQASELKQRHRAVVRTARELTQEQRSAIQAQLDRIYGQPMDLDVDVDPDVMGGVVITVGDEVIDGSVARKLADARQRLR